MAKILQFRLPGRDFIAPATSNPVSPRKEPIVLSAMPDQAFPAGHQDFRPLLQRDGLILLSWARWEDGEGDGSLVRQYVINWITTCGTYRHYASKPVSEKELERASPERNGDPLFYRGAYGNRFDIKDYSEKNIADYLYLAAPFDLDRETIPGYIRVLKALGSTVDFDLVFTLGAARKSQAQEYLEKLASTQVANSL
jgi:hypothetical protein